MRIALVFMLALSLAACGGSSIEPEPLIETTVEGSYDGDDFTPINGFVGTTTGGNTVIVLGDGPIGCGTESASSPPRGHTGIIGVETLAVGSDPSVFVQLISNVGEYQGVGSSNGALTITAVTETTVTGEISFTYTDAQSREFTLSGAFEATRCD